MAFCRFAALCACEQLASNSTSNAIFKLALENRAPRAGADSRAAQAGRRPAHAGCAGCQARLRLSACSLRQVAHVGSQPQMCLKLSNFLRFSRVQSSSGNAAKQGKSPPGDGVQTRTTAAKGTALTSACGNADEGTAASDAARGLDAQRPGRTAPALPGGPPAGGPRGCSWPWRAATSRQS